MKTDGSNWLWYKSYLQQNSRSWMVLCICHVNGARLRWCPIIEFKFFVIGYPWHLHVNYELFNCFLPCSFQTVWKVLQTFLLQKSPQKTFLNPKFIIDTINQLLDLVSYNSRSNRAGNFKSYSRSFEITPWIVLCSVQLLLVIRSDEGLTLEMSAFESLYGG